MGGGGMFEAKLILRGLVLCQELDRNTACFSPSITFFVLPHDQTMTLLLALPNCLELFPSVPRYPPPHVPIIACFVDCGRSSEAARVL